MNGFHKEKYEYYKEYQKERQLVNLHRISRYYLRFKINNVI